MSETGTRIPRAQAEELAGEIMELLAPYTTRLEVVGSIRRRKADCGDVEILAVPRFEEWPGGDLFGGMVRVNVLNERCRELMEASPFRLRLRGRGAFGERYKQLEYRGFALDLFSCLPPASWGVLQVIRTGPADFSHRFVSPRRHGGMMPEWAHVRDGAIWHLDGQLIEAPEETDVFRVLGIPYLDPEARV